MSRRYGDSYSNAVIIRILQVLIDGGQLKKTWLTGKAGINYGTCMKYLDLLLKLQWVKRVHDNDNADFISISTEGIANLRKLQTEYQHTTSVSSSSSYSEQRSINLHKPSLIREKANTSRADSNVKNIVIVDDDENSLMTYTSFLENRGNFRIETFSNSRKALEFLTFHSNSYDLVILDIRMPELSGLRLLQGIKASNPNAKVIFLSALDAAPEISEFFSDAYQPCKLLRKPVSRDSFLKTVSNALS
jgi:CheY-like chemotaxis protein/predicted transcriptional regulator